MFYSHGQHCVIKLKLREQRTIAESWDVTHALPSLTLLMTLITRILWC